MKRLFFLFAILLGLSFMMNANTTALDQSGPPGVTVTYNDLATVPVSVDLTINTFEVTNMPTVAIELQETIVEVKEASPLRILTKNNMAILSTTELTLLSCQKKYNILFRYG